MYLYLLKKKTSISKNLTNLTNRKKEKLDCNCEFSNLSDATWYIQLSRQRNRHKFIDLSLVFAKTIDALAYTELNSTNCEALNSRRKNEELFLTVAR